MSVVEVREDGPVSIISINRPDRRNAINQQVALDLQSAFAAFDASGQRVAVLTGAGDDAFSAGADFTDLPELWRCIPTVGITTDKPIIAAVTGWCIGGALVAVMACDLCVASESAKFSYPEARLGFTGGMIAGLAARIPHKVAMEVMLLGATLDARRAYEVGLVIRVVANGQQVHEAVAMARELAESAPLVLSTIKRFVTETILPKGPSELMGRATRELGAVRESEDAAEGMQAAREKRKPVYKGR